MIFVFILIFIGALITVPIWRCDSYLGKVSLVVCSIVISLICSVGLLTSYVSYVGMRASYDTVIHQHRQAITMYEDMAILSVKEASLTDFKYEGYQNNVASFVLSLRKNVIDYNTRLVKKRTYKKSIVFNWITVGPDDDMKLINLID